MKIVLVSSPVDATDSSRMLVDLVADFAAGEGSPDIHVVAPRIAADRLDRFEAIGVRLLVTAGGGARGLETKLALDRRDLVLLNGAGLDPADRRRILRALRTGRLEHAYWLIHEDVRELPSVTAAVAAVDLRRRLTELIAGGRLTLLATSARLKAQYDDLLNGDLVTTLVPFVGIPDRLMRARPIDDYRAIAFLSSASGANGRDGQLVVSFAFQELMRRYVEADPAAYRDFTLTLIGVADDYVSEQAKTIGASALGHRLRTFPMTTQEAALEVAHGCNAVISCGLSAAFPWFVTEAMAMGHVVVRNDAGGRDEQLRDGENGYLVDSGDVGRVAQVLETILNREKTSEAALQAMGAASQAISKPYVNGSYREYFERERKR